MDHMYKSQLQTYALKHNSELPVYAAERAGPAHAPHFRCKVTVSGKTFQSDEFFPTLRAAEHAAAKAALASLAPVNPEGLVDVAYKNLLQEIAQKENSLLPVYATASSGPSHAPTFTSSVEFAGKVFKGEEAKTKKLAELSAAKVAFMCLKYGHHPKETSSSPSSSRERQQEVAESNLKSSVQESPSKMVIPDVPSKWVEVYDDDRPAVISAPVNDPKSIDVSAPAVSESPTEMNVAVSSQMPQELTNNGPVSAPAVKAIESNVAVIASLPMSQNPTNKRCNERSSVEEENEKKKLIIGTGHQKVPTGQHVICCPCDPEFTLPQDAEMLARDDKFIAYRLAKP